MLLAFFYPDCTKKPNNIDVPARDYAGKLAVCSLIVCTMNAQRTVSTQVQEEQPVAPATSPPTRTKMDVFCPTRRWRRRLLMKTVGRMVRDHAGTIPFGPLQKGASRAEHFIHILRDELLRTHIPGAVEASPATEGIHCCVARFKIIAMGNLPRTIKDADRQQRHCLSDKPYFLGFPSFIRITWFLFQFCANYPLSTSQLFRAYADELVQWDMPWYRLVDEPSEDWSKQSDSIFCSDNTIYILLLVLLIIFMLVVAVMFTYYGCIAEVTGRFI
ncbi:MAG: hypothetical protein GY696_21145 [Gammaproteobacteria bacterium]|nr:hypothetical protein [Gammaproteobacteria bacterium]